MEDELREALVQQITLAFAKTPKPPQIIISTDDGVQEAFYGKKWQAIPYETLVKHVIDLPMFSPYAFRYFIPAFMIALILNPGKSNNLPDFIMFSLLLPDDLLSDPKSAFHHIVNRMTLEERRAIYEFLVAFPQLEPYTVWAYLEESQQELQSAIDFWRAKSEIDTN